MEKLNSQSVEALGLLKLTMVAAGYSRSSSGIRFEELRMLKLTDIESKNNRIVVRCGKGRKDRYTLLSKRLVETLRNYYRRQQQKPKIQY